MADTRFRRRRLLNLLPRIFAEQGESTVVATVIEAMAAGLADLDESIIRTQRDHWVDFATADTDNGEAPGALERLGTLLGIPKLNGESVEDYRQRLPMTARVLTRGLTSPRSLLELAVVTLGAELCPRLLYVKDAILGFGFPLGTLRNCPNCQSNNESSCPNMEKRVLDAWITENPPQRRTFKPLTPLQAGGRFILDNLSLTEDVPEIRIQALDTPVQYPFIQNRATGEIILYAGIINLGEVLSVWPLISAEEVLNFDSYDGEINHNWFRQYPMGSAVLIGVDGSIQSVDTKIYFLTGSMFPPEKIAADAQDAPRFATTQATEGVRFADALSQGSCFDTTAVFADTNDSKGACFGGSNQRIRSPRVRSGHDEWMYGVYTQQDIKAIAGDNVGALLDNAPVSAGNAQVALSLSWWVRLPASFRMNIPRSAWIGKAETRGATNQVVHWIQQAKAAGVLALVDFPEQALRESHTLLENEKIHTRQRWQESLLIEDNTPGFGLHSINQENQNLSEGALSWQGVFDTTRLDGSRFN